MGKIESRFKHPSNLNSSAWIPQKICWGKREEIHFFPKKESSDPKTEHCTQGHTEREQNWEQKPRLLLPKPQTFPSGFPNGVPACAILGLASPPGQRATDQLGPRPAGSQVSLVNNQWRASPVYRSQRGPPRPGSVPAPPGGNPAMQVNSLSFCLLRKETKSISGMGKFKGETCPPSHQGTQMA